MIANPIIRKEVLTSLRTKKAVAMQALFLLALGALVLNYWPSAGLQDVGGVAARKILSIIAISELALVALFAPAFTAAAMTMEREKKTLESLFSTTLKPWEIASGKMVGSLSFLILIVISGIPAVALPLLLGGVTVADVLAVVGLLLLTAVYLGSIGLFISTIMHRSYRSIITTYAALLLIFFVFATPAWPISRNLLTRGGPFWQGVLHIITSLSPLEAMISVIWPQSNYAQGAQGMPEFWKIHIPLALLVIVAAAIACVMKIRKPIAPPRAREKLKVIERGFSARSVLFLVDPRKRKRMIQWWQNPILVKEFRTRPLLQSHRLIRICLMCLVASILLMLATNISVSAFVGEEGATVAGVGEQAGQTMGMIPMICTAIGILLVVMILLVGPATTSGAISSDIEMGVWELIRCTRIPSWRIVSGKFLASIIPLVLLVVSVMPAMVVMLYIDMNIWPNILRVLVVVGMAVLFVSTAGVCFSSLTCKTSAATAWTYGLIIALGMMSMLTLMADNTYSDRVLRLIYVINPVVVVMDAAGYPDLQKFDLIGEYLRIFGLASLGMFAVAVLRVIRLRQPD
jgi:ABC-type transport system involved in multi-copper enzyme maturation permease subunit